jgi:tetratricopeptide (TPR) repeat protein
MRSLRGLGKFEEANEALDRVIELDPDDVRFWTMKADTLYRLERYREAASVAEHARHIDSEYPPAYRIHEKALKLMYQRKEKKKR